MNRMALALFGRSEDRPWEYVLTEYIEKYEEIHRKAGTEGWLTQGEIERKHGKKEARMLIQHGYFDTKELADGTLLFRKWLLIESVSKHHNERSFPYALRARLLTMRSDVAESELAALMRERHQEEDSCPVQDSSSECDREQRRQMLKRQARDDGKETEDEKENKAKKEKKEKKAKNEQEEPGEPPEGTGGQYEKEVDPLAEPRRQSRKADGQIVDVQALLNKLEVSKIHLSNVKQDLQNLTAKKQS